MDPEIRKDKESTAKKCLSKVKVLSLFPNKQNELDEYFASNNITIESIVSQTGYSLIEHHEALSIFTTCIVIILMRNINEIFVNNYNREWILAWNGNLRHSNVLRLFWVNVKNTAASTFAVKNHRNHYETPYFML